MIVRIVPIIRFPQDRAFDYSIPEGNQLPQIGSLLRVNFHHRKILGVVFEIPEQAEIPLEKVQPVIEILEDGKPLLSKDLIQLIIKLSFHYQVPRFTSTTAIDS